MIETFFKKGVVENCALQGGRTSQGKEEGVSSSFHRIPIWDIFASYKHTKQMSIRGALRNKDRYGNGKNTQI
jgi:hypothetical protein